MAQQSLSSTDKRALLAQLLQQKREAYRYPLSYGQQALWFIYQSAPDSPAYNMAWPLELKGKLNVTALRQALQALVNRHLTLQSTIEVVDGEPQQTVHPTGTYQWSEHQAIEWTPEQLKMALRTAYEQPFDLTQGPVLRADLFQTAQEKHVLLLTMHHIFGDASSMAILETELLTLYQAELSGQKATLPTISSSYADFVRAESALLANSEGERLAHYWQQQLAGEIPILNLPTDYPRPTIQRYNGASRPFPLPADLGQQLKQLAQQEKTTLFGLLLTAFQLLLHRYTGQSEIWLGTPTSTSRRQSQFANLVGYLVNPVVIRTSIDATAKLSFRELLVQTKQTVVEAIDHSAYPFPLLVKSLQPQRDWSYAPLFQVMIDFQPETSPPLEREVAGLTVSMVELPQMEGQFDVVLSLCEGTCIAGALNYNTDLFKPETIERMVGHLQTLLTGIVSNPDQSITELPLLTEAERQQILVEWNDTATDYPTDKTIHQLFEEQVTRTPDNIAVLFEDDQLTYRELNNRSNQLAHHLRTLGVGPEVLVGICVERSIEMVVGLLGILKAGGAYLPLDPTYPAERLAFMLTDANVSVLLTQSHLREGLPVGALRQAQGTIKVVCLDRDWAEIEPLPHANLEVAVKPDNLVYVIYTSGSTGQPKGVMIEQGALAHHISHMTSLYQLTPMDRVLQFATISFDTAHEQIFATLISGAGLVLRGNAVWSLAEFNQNLLKYGLTVIDLSPAYLHELFLNWLNQSNQFFTSQLRLIITGGEKITPATLRLWQQLSTKHKVRFINAYGPTEATIGATIFDLTDYPIDETIKNLPIGRPIDNVQTYVLDKSGQPVPIGVSGELHIGGAGLARGYLNRPDLTAEKFIPNPFGEGRLYKTGDLARWLPDGNIEFIGRLDHQVKIRGFRIELGEIETVLTQHEAVQDVVVMAKDSGDQKRLVAYLTPNSQHLIPELRAYLQEKLPAYMIPSAFVLLDEFPLTPNGKVDRNALPRLEMGNLATDRVYESPQTPTEELLAAIWAAVLGREQIGRHDDFFELGGHSLLAIQLMAKIEANMGQRLPLTRLFQAPTIAQFAKLLSQDGSAQPNLALVPLQPTGHQPAFFCFPGAGTTVLYLRELAQQLGVNQPFYGLQPPGLEANTTILSNMTELVAFFRSALTTKNMAEIQHLGGHSAGGMMAFALALALQEAGYTVPQLTLFEALPPGTETVVADYPVTVPDKQHAFIELMQVLQETLGDEFSISLSELEPLSETERWAYLSNGSGIKLDIEYLKRLVTSYQKTTEMMVTYQPPGRYQGQLTLFLAEESPLATLDGVISGWQAVCEKPVIVQRVPGNHLSLLKSPHVERLAERLQDLLNNYA